MKAIKWLLMSCLSGLLLLSSREAKAQAPPPVVITPVLTRADTLQALHTLFLANRRRGRVMSGLVPVLVGATAYSASQVEIYIDLSGTGQRDISHDLPIITTFLGGLGALVMAWLGPNTWSRNSKEREKEAVRLYEQRKPLPKRVQRQLHNRLEMMLNQSQVAQK
jgi:hypothetical protein